jgi:[ribosomal protein S5]-alanine N-acetyltransferase
MSAMPLHTERLQLVPSTPEEVRAQVARMDARDKAELSPEWLTRLNAATTIDPWVLGFSIVLTATGAVIGTCGFKGPPDADGMVEIAYGIAPEYRNSGYATDAAAELVRFAFGTPQVRVVCAHTTEEAGASARVLEKCSFRSCGQVMEPDDGLVWRWEITQ